MPQSTPLPRPRRRQEITAVPTRAPYVRPTPEAPCLVVLEGPRLGDCIHLHSVPVVIGRDPRSDFLLPDPSVSRRHCTVWREDGLDWLRDLRSRNGCVVNGHRVSRALLNEGDHVVLGDVVLMFVSGRMEAGYHQALSALAARDTLTGLLNRRRLREALDDAVALHPPDEPVAAVIVDIDHFKSINDRLGHDAGDVVLRAVAQCVQAMLGPGESAGRMGGDEIALVLLADAAQARARCDTLRATLAALAGTLPDGGAPVTLSIGIASGGFRSPGELLHAADHALLDAKRSGRDAVRCAP